jgi:polysaccharide deacetylase family protein (PEP-CTERM system associated)
VTSTEQGATTDPKVVNAMTVDVEDYFQVSVFEGIAPRPVWDRFESRVCANTERLLALFAESGVKATFFILGWIGERHPGLVRRISDCGHEIASHGYAHRLVYDLTKTAFRDDARRAKGILEAASGTPVVGYRAPSYSITPRSLWALDILIEEGFRYDASIFPIHHDRYGIPVSPRHPYVINRSGGSLIEAPASTVGTRLLNLPIGGGGYFRLLPYAWTRWGVNYINTTEKRPCIFYLHPWEIDPDQPRLQCSWLGRLRHYRNLDQTEPRLRRLLREFCFGPMSQVLPAAVQAPCGSGPLPATPLPYLW